MYVNKDLNKEMLKHKLFKRKEIKKKNRLTIRYNFLFIYTYMYMLYNIISMKYHNNNNKFIYLFTSN